MTECQVCGFRNADDQTFCDSCGAFLEWSSNPAAATDVPAASNTIQMDATLDLRSPAGPPLPPVPARPARMTAPAYGHRGLLFSTDHAPGEDGLIRRGITAVEDDNPVPPPPLAATVVAPRPPPPRPPKPPPPPTPPPGTPGGHMATRPPPMDRDGDPWDPPTESGEGVRRGPDLAAMRRIARPFADRTGANAATRLLIAPNRVRGVEVTTITVDPAEADDPPPPPEGTGNGSVAGPLLPGLQRSFDHPVTPPRAPPTRTPQPGDTVCQTCGETNLAGRSFCRRCASALDVPVAIEETVVLPWWRRWLPRRWRDRQPRPSRRERRYRAGERPAGASRVTGESRWRIIWRRITRLGRVGVNYLLAILAILALVGTVLPQAAPVRRDIVNRLESVGQRFQNFLVPQFVPLNPIAVIASSELDGFPATQVADGFSNRYWAEGVDGNGIGSRLTFTFQEPVDLAKLAFINGGVPPRTEFASQPRPRRLTLFFDDGTFEEIELRDEPDFQEVTVDAPPTTRLTIRIDSVYESLSGGTTTSITEIEFLRRL